MDAGVKIGVGITTRNRSDVLNYTLERHRLYTKGKVVIVDDGGEERQNVKEGGYEYVWHERKGIPASKNRCIELLKDCDYIFLLDDDIVPVKEWQQAYIEAHEAHPEEKCLMWMTQINGLKAEKEKIDEYKRIQGCLFSLTTKEKWDEEYGLYGYADYSYANKLKTKGLITGFHSIKNAIEYFYSFDCMMPRPADFKGKFRSTMTAIEKTREQERNKERFITEYNKLP